MEARFEIFPEKKLIGKCLKMTYADNKTFELWKSFMPYRKDIKNVLSGDLFSIQIYDKNFDFNKFDANAGFEKWAAMEVRDFENIPAGMKPFILSTGQYAVFIHKGPATNGPETFRYIFNEWIPASEYMIDNRPHFEILGEKYKNDDPHSEEEIWIPVKHK